MVAVADESSGSWRCKDTPLRFVKKKKDQHAKCRKEAEHLSMVAVADEPSGSWRCKDTPLRFVKKKERSTCKMPQGIV